jgi:hypothetical protein
MISKEQYEHTSEERAARPLLHPHARTRMMSREIPKERYEHIAVEGIKYDPFGPHFLHLKLHEKLRQDLLTVVNDIRNDPEEHKKCDELKEPLFAEYLNASIHDGESISITRNIDKRYGYIVENLLKELTSMYAEVAPYNVEVFEAWYVVMKEGDFHVLHAHEGTTEEFEERINLAKSPQHTALSEGYRNIRLFSGSIYLQIPDDLKFPQGNINFVLGSPDQIMYRAHHYVSPQSGEAMMWPAWLKHDVCPFRSKQERIMISFNTGIT